MISSAKNSTVQKTSYFVNLGVKTLQLYSNNWLMSLAYNHIFAFG